MQYRDIHEFHNGCYYCVYENIARRKMEHSIHPPLVCEQCPRGINGAHEEFDMGEDGEKGRLRR